MTTAAHRQTPPPASDTAHIKRVPARVDARGAIRARAAELAVALDPSAPPSFEALRAMAAVRPFWGFRPYGAL